MFILKNSFHVGVGTWRMQSYGSACLARRSVSERSTLFFYIKHQMLWRRTRPKWQFSSSKISRYDNKKFACNTIIFLKKAQNRYSHELRMFFKTGIFPLVIKETSKCSVSKLVNWHMIFWIMFNVIWLREFCGWLSYLEYEQ